MLLYDIVIVGGGVAGMAAAITAKKEGIDKVLIIDREEEFGGTLIQCIHNGFGRKTIGKEVTAPEYINFFVEQIKKFNIDVKLNTLVLDINSSKEITIVNPEDGMKRIKARSIILATGCREKYIGHMNISSNNFVGIYTIETAHQFVTMEGYLPGKEILIIGSSDISLIIARRLIVEGANIKAIIERNPYIMAKREKVKNIIDDFNIPVITSAVLGRIKGNERVNEVEINKIDLNGNLKDTINFKCDTVLLSIDRFPERDLAVKADLDMKDEMSGPLINDKFQCSVDGILACGSLVNKSLWADDIVEQGFISGKVAAEYVKK